MKLKNPIKLTEFQDILQDTTSLMWKKFDEFKDGTSFSGWGIQIAKYKILEFRRKNRKEVDLSDKVFNELLEQSEKQHSKFNFAQDALERCMKKVT